MGTRFVLQSKRLWLGIDGTISIEALGRFQLLSISCRRVGASAPAASRSRKPKLQTKLETDPPPRRARPAGTPLSEERRAMSETLGHTDRRRPGKGAQLVHSLKAEMAMHRLAFDPQACLGRIWASRRLWSAPNLAGQQRQRSGMIFR